MDAERKPIELVPPGLSHDLIYEGRDEKGQPITVTVYRPDGSENDPGQSD